MRRVKFLHFPSVSFRPVVSKKDTEKEKYMDEELIFKFSRATLMSFKTVSWIFEVSSVSFCRKQYRTFGIQQPGNWSTNKSSFPFINLIGSFNRLINIWRYEASHALMEYLLREILNERFQVWVKSGVGFIFETILGKYR